MKKRILSLVLALSMMMSLFPVSVLADTGGGIFATPFAASNSNVIHLDDIIAERGAASEAGENNYPEYPLGCGKDCKTAVSGTGWHYEPYADAADDDRVKGVLYLEEGYTFDLTDEYDWWIQCDVVNYGTIDGEGMTTTHYDYGGEYTYTSRVEFYGMVENYGTIENCLMRRSYNNHAGATLRYDFLQLYYADEATNDGEIVNSYIDGDRGSATPYYTNYTLNGSGTVEQCYVGATVFENGTTNTIKDCLFTCDPGLSDVHKIVYNSTKYGDNYVFEFNIPETAEHWSAASASYLKAAYFIGSPTLWLKGDSTNPIRTINNTLVVKGVKIPGVKSIEEINDTEYSVTLIPTGDSDLTMTQAEPVNDLKFDENGLPIGTSGTNWTYNEKDGLTLSGGAWDFTNDKAINCKVTINEGVVVSGGKFKTTVYNYGTIKDGQFDYCYNYGSIEGGTFDHGEHMSFCVSNHGSISGGTFKQTVTNDKNDTTVISTISGGKFIGSVSNYGKIEDGEFADCDNKTSGTIEGGTFGTVTNYGKINNGTFNGAVTNDYNSYINGGTFKGKVTNYGIIRQNPVFEGEVNNNKSIWSGTFLGTITGDTSNSAFKFGVCKEAPSGVPESDIYTIKAGDESYSVYVSCDDAGAEPFVNYGASGPQIVKRSDWGGQISVKLYKDETAVPIENISGKAVTAFTNGEYIDDAHTVVSIDLYGLPNANETLVLNDTVINYDTSLSFKDDGIPDDDNREKIYADDGTTVIGWKGTNWTYENGILTLTGGKWDFSKVEKINCTVIVESGATVKNGVFWQDVTNSGDMQNCSFLRNVKNNSGATITESTFRLMAAEYTVTDSGTISNSVSDVKLKDSKTLTHARNMTIYAVVDGCRVDEDLSANNPYGSTLYVVGTPTLKFKLLNSASLENIDGNPVGEDIKKDEAGWYTIKATGKDMVLDQETYLLTVEEGKIISGTNGTINDDEASGYFAEGAVITIQMDAPLSGYIRGLEFQKGSDAYPLDYTPVDDKPYTYTFIMPEAGQGLYVFAIPGSYPELGIITSGDDIGKPYVSKAEILENGVYKGDGWVYDDNTETLTLDKAGETINVIPPRISEDDNTDVDIVLNVNLVVEKGTTAWSSSGSKYTKDVTNHGEIQNARIESTGAVVNDGTMKNNAISAASVTNSGTITNAVIHNGGTFSNTGTIESSVLDVKPDGVDSSVLHVLKEKNGGTVSATLRSKEYAVSGKELYIVGNSDLRVKLNDGDEITNVNGTNSIGVQKLNGEDGWYLISSIPANNDDLVLNQTVPTYKLKLENAEILDTDKTEFEAGERVRIRPKFDDPEKEFAEWQTWPISYVGIEPNGDGTYTLTMPSSELTLTAHYSMKQYTLTVKNGCIEGIEGLDTGSYEKGVVHKLTANEAAKGKEFDKWELSDGLEIVEGDETSETISVKMPGKDATATATYKDKTVTPDPDPKPDPDPDPTDPDQPDPNPDEKNTYTLTVEGGLLNGKSAADGVEVKAGDKITVTVDDAEIPQSMAFNGWNVPTELIDAVNKEIAPNILDTNANTLEFTMPDSLTNGGEYTIRALYCPDEIAEERPAISSGLSTAAVVAVGGAAAGVAVWQGVSLGVDAYLANALPKGVAVPTNRRELVVLLWQTAGKPEVELPALYSDISAEEIELQKASRWAVANGLVKDADKNDASRFDPDHYVTKMDVFGAWLKLKKLMKK